MASFFHRTAWLVVLLFLFSCHDAPRTNPFDPALTPAVELSVALDDTAGTATLTWSGYEGQQPFREYRVLRKQSGLEKVDTLEHLTSVEQTTFVDSSLAPDTDYLYRVSVVNSGGLEVPSQEEEARPLSLPVVQLQKPVFDSRTASAALQWTRYQGPRFKAYRVERRSAGLTPQVIGEILDIADTSLVDSGLVGNIEHVYRVVVETERGEELASEEVSGAFHQLVATWPLEVEEGGYVRLYWEEDRLAALVASSTSRSTVRVLFFDPQGTSLEEQVFLDQRRDMDLYYPHAVSMARNPEGGHFLGMRPSQFASILYFDSDGRPREQVFFADSLAQLPPEASNVEGEILFSIEYVVDRGGRDTTVDNVAIAAEGQVLFADDFEDEGLEGWEHEGPISFAKGRVAFSRSGRLAKADTSWKNFSLGTDVALTGIDFSLSLGSLFSNSAFTLSLPWVDGVGFEGMGLNWSFTAPPNSGLNNQSRNFSAHVPFPPFLTYRLGLGSVDGRFRVSIAGLPIWNFESEVAHTSSQAFIDEAQGQVLAFTVGGQGYSLRPGEESPLDERRLDGPVSEIRTWEVAGTARKRLGLCLPSLHQVLVREEEALITASGIAKWPIGGVIGTTIGTIGSRAGELLFPLSFDAGPDGRVYVLDAGNGRIQVFDVKGKYLTQWGRKGSGEGEFDFGSGRVPEDFAGSVAVDEEGYIYVADVGNQRIQKFAP